MKTCFAVCLLANNSRDFSGCSAGILSHVCIPQTKEDFVNIREGPRLQLLTPLAPNTSLVDMTGDTYKVIWRCWYLYCQRAPTILRCLCNAMLHPPRVTRVEACEAWDKWTRGFGLIHCCGWWWCMTTYLKARSQSIGSLYCLVFSCSSDIYLIAK